MIDGMVFPNMRECFEELIDGTTHLEKPVRLVWHLKADDYGALLGPFPVILVETNGGSEGYIDRVDRVSLECYAPGTRAVETLESVKASICGDNIETSHGFLDNIKVDQLPQDVPYQTASLNMARVSFLVTSRPL